MTTLPEHGPIVLTGGSGRLGTELQALLRREIGQAGGWLGFERYMELALYAPGLGYYSGGSRQFGQLARDGSDFVTAPELSPLFGHALAAQVGVEPAQMQALMSEIVNSPVCSIARRVSLRPLEVNSTIGGS